MVRIFCLPIKRFDVWFSTFIFNGDHTNILLFAYGALLLSSQLVCSGSPYFDVGLCNVHRFEKSFLERFDTKILKKVEVNGWFSWSVTISAIVHNFQLGRGLGCSFGGITVLKSSGGGPSTFEAAMKHAFLMACDNLRSPVDLIIENAVCILFLSCNT